MPEPRKQLSAVRNILKCCLSWMLVMPSPVLAQPEANRDTVAVLEEITVTARRATENLQDVPMTVNVLTADAIDKKGLSDFSQVQEVTSNLIWTDSGGGAFRNQVTIRGISSGASVFGFDPGVGIYIDDVYIGNEVGFNFALLDVDRIEILKGPQGTLFGRNTTAGAIAVHTRRPSPDALSVDASWRIGAYNLTEARLMTNLPLGERVALKLSGIYRNRDGYQRNTLNGRRELNDENYRGARIQLLWLATDYFELRATADYFENDDKQGIMSCAGPPFCDPINPTRTAVFDDRAADNDTVSTRTTWSTSLDATWSLSDYEVKSISSFRSVDAFSDQDQDYTHLDILRSGFLLPLDRQFSQELRLTTPQHRRLRGVGGIYYFTQERETAIPLIVEPMGMELIGGAAEQLVQLTDSRQETDSWAVYSQGYYNLTDRLIAELGLRYTHDSKDFTYEQSVNDAVDTLPPEIIEAFYFIPFPRSTGSDSWGKATGTASLSWSLADNARLYVRYSMGYKSGGFQAFTNSEGLLPTQPFDPETLDQYEIGLKSELLNRRLRINAAAFRMDYDDIQVQITDPVTRQKFVTNFGRARSDGLELEVSLMASQRLALDGNVGVQNARFTDGPNAGRRLQYAPRTSGSLTTTYEQPMWGDWTGMGSATVAYRSRMYLNPENAFVDSGSVTTVNARIGVEHSDRRWGLHIWGHNLGNSRRFTSYSTPTVATPEAFHLSAPRTYGLELHASF